VDAILSDYETATIDERLRGALHFLATLDPERALDAGVSRDALRDAAEVKAWLTQKLEQQSSSARDADGYELPDY